MFIFSNVQFGVQLRKLSAPCCEGQMLGQGPAATSNRHQQYLEFIHLDPRTRKARRGGTWPKRLLDYDLLG